jgi:hypothetical protein
MKKTTKKIKRVQHDWHVYHWWRYHLQQRQAEYMSWADAGLILLPCA